MLRNHQGAGGKKSPAIQVPAQGKHRLDGALSTVGSAPTEYSKAEAAANALDIRGLLRSRKG